MAEEKKKQKDVVHEDYNSEYESTEFEIDEEYLESTDYLPSEEAEDFDEDAPDIVEYDVFGKDINDPDNPNRQEEDYFEAQLRKEFSDEEIAEQRRKNRIFLNRDRDVSIEKDKKAQNIRKALESGTYDYLSDVEDFDDHLEFLDSVQDMLMQSPLFVLEQLREKRAKAVAQEKADRLTHDGAINIMDLCHSLDETYMISQQPSAVDIRQEITESMYTLMKMAKDVFGQAALYTDGELASLIGVLNKVCGNREFLGIAVSRDVYFRFVVDYANDLLAKHKEVPPEVISALNILIRINAKLLNVILLEKTEEYAPIIGYINGMKKNKKL